MVPVRDNTGISYPVVLYLCLYILLVTHCTAAFAGHTVTLRSNNNDRIVRVTTEAGQNARVEVNKKYLTRYVDCTSGLNGLFSRYTAWFVEVTPKDGKEVLPLASRIQVNKQPFYFGTPVCYESVLLPPDAEPEGDIFQFCIISASDLVSSKSKDISVDLSEPLMSENKPLPATPPIQSVCMPAVTLKWTFVFSESVSVRGLEAANYIEHTTGSVSDETVCSFSLSLPNMVSPQFTVQILPAGKLRRFSVEPVSGSGTSDIIVITYLRCSIPSDLDIERLLPVSGLGFNRLNQSLEVACKIVNRECVLQQTVGRINCAMVHVEEEGATQCYHHALIPLPENDTSTNLLYPEQRNEIKYQKMREVLEHYLYRMGVSPQRRESSLKLMSGSLLERLRHREQSRWRQTEDDCLRRVLEDSLHSDFEQTEDELL
ncbi:hypothetical protein ACWJJH_21915 [Endozoicomonadaceae bacterium StTr2]